MPKPKQIRLLTIPIVASVTCCLISLGLFIHFTTLPRPVAEEEKKKPDPIRKESIDELISLRGREKILLKKIALLEKEVALIKSSGEDMRKKLDMAQNEHDRLLQERNMLKQKLIVSQKVFIVTALNEGKSSRNRQTTFVECKANGIIVQPSGKEFSLSLGPEEEVAFLSIVSQTRYVVFLIRPDGYEAFFRYRNIVNLRNRSSNAPIDIGYEPVNADWVLHYPGQKG